MDILNVEFRIQKSLGGSTRTEQKTGVVSTEIG